MTSCTVCGANLDVGAAACPACAAPVSHSATSPGDTGEVPATVGAGTAATSTTPPPGAGPAAYGPPPATWSPPHTPGAWTPPHRSGLPGDARGWALGAHLAGLGAALLTATIFGFVGPLVVWLLKRDEDPFVEHHAKEALNFQLTVLVAIGASVLLFIPAVIIGILTLGLGLLLLAGLVIAAVVAWFVLPIIGAVKAADGHGYRYPFTIRFVR